MTTQQPPLNPDDELNKTPMVNQWCELAMHADVPAVYIVSEHRTECVKCGAGTSNALPIVHEDGCVQGYIYDARQTTTAQRILNETNKQEKE